MLTQPWTPIWRGEEMGILDDVLSEAKLEFLRANIERIAQARLRSEVDSTGSTNDSSTFRDAGR